MNKSENVGCLAQTANEFVHALLRQLGDAGVEPGILKTGYRRIIAGKSYSTTTAEWLASTNSSPGTEDYQWFSESLYRTFNGAFFLAGEGMEGTPWSDRTCGEARRGHRILPLTDNQARGWLELRKLTQEYEEIFGLPPEAGS